MVYGGFNPDYALEVFYGEQGVFFSANSASYSPTSALNGPRLLFNQLFNAEITERDAEAAEIKSASNYLSRNTFVSD